MIFLDNREKNVIRAGPIVFKGKSIYIDAMKTAWLS